MPGYEATIPGKPWDFNASDATFDCINAENGD